MKSTVISLTLTGGAGASAGADRFNVGPCKLAGIQIQYLTQPAGCHLLITNTCNGLAKTLLEVTGNTDIPLVGLSELTIDDAGTPTTIGAPPRLLGQIDVAVDSGDDADPGVTVTIVTEAG